MAVNIRIDVDDADVDIAIAKLQQAVTLQGTLTSGGISGTRGGTRSLMQEWLAFEKTASQLPQLGRELSAMERIAGTDLPGINREMRIILGQIPGMREAMQVLFTVKRLQRGVGKTLETGAI